MRQKLLDLYKKHGDILRYLIIGGLTTLANVVVYAILTEGFSIHYQVANIISWLVAVIFAFVGNKWVVFRTRERDAHSLLREAGSFFLMRLLTLGFDAGALYVMVEWLHMDEMIAKIISTAAVIVLNYVLSKLVVFRNAQ